MGLTLPWRMAHDDHAWAPADRRAAMWRYPDPTLTVTDLHVVVCCAQCTITCARC